MWIILTGDMVLATLEDRKTVTRRTRGLEEINKNPDKWEVYCYPNENGLWAWFSTKAGIPYEQIIIKCPYGKPGDRLWVRETWAYPLDYNTPDLEPDTSKVFYKADSDILAQGNRWRSPRFMSREASRIDLLIKALWAERLQEITEEECFSEGFRPAGDFLFSPQSAARVRFGLTWDSLNPKYPFSLNPWAWRIAYERVAKLTPYLSKEESPDHPICPGGLR